LRSIEDISLKGQDLSSPHGTTNNCGTVPFCGFSAFGHDKIKKITGRIKKDVVLDENL